MTPDASTSDKGVKAPFVIREMEGYLPPDNESNAEKGEEIARDISHVMKRDYRCKPSMLHCPFSKPEDFEQGDATDSASHDAEASWDEASPDEDTEWQEMEEYWPGFSELIELSDDECVYHYNRIIRGDFPWESFHDLVQKGKKAGEIEQENSSEWFQLYGKHESHRRRTTVGDAKNIDMIRCLVNDVLLWALVLDRFYDVPETADIIDAFKKPWLTLYVEWEEFMIEIKVVNGRRLMML